MSRPSAAALRVKAVRHALSNWARENIRNFPWRREGATPYEILVAEFLVKRTTATAASRLYPSFIAQFPTVAALTQAGVSELETALAPIGLQAQRAAAIRELGVHIANRHGGQIPSSLDDLVNVPGLGAYSARAILSFGFGVPAAIVDSNVTRVLGRVFARTMGHESGLGAYQELADSLLPNDGHQVHNYALLDLGSSVCRYDAPRCADCPLSSLCDSAGIPLERPPNAEGVALRAVRRAANLSQAKLASEAGVSKATVVALELGRRNPRPATVRVLREAAAAYSAKTDRASRNPRNADSS